METIFSENISALLLQLGTRLRTERLARNESQTRFAARIGVSVPTLRRKEQGDASAQIGHWLVFNALLGNTDDHLKNFWLLTDASGYRLSPAFDLLPDTGARREHVLLFDLTPRPPSPAELAALGRKWGVSGAASICQEVEAGVRRFSEIAAVQRVPSEEISRFAQDIARRCRTDR